MSDFLIRHVPVIRQKLKSVTCTQAATPMEETVLKVDADDPDDAQLSRMAMRLRERALVCCDVDWKLMKLLLFKATCSTIRTRE